MDRTDSNHFIPFPRAQIFQMILNDGRLSGDQRNKFEQFCQMMDSIYHFEFHKKLESLKSSYRPFSPDIESESITAGTANFLDVEQECISSIEDILTKGNYAQISDAQLNMALAEEGLFPISAEVDFESFSFYRIYYQGQQRGTAKVKDWIPFKEKEIEFEFFDRIVFLFQQNNSMPLSNETIVSGTNGLKKIYLKYFRNIPKSDLEMIFPNPKPRMKLIHRLKIGIPLFIGFVIAMQKFIIGPYLLGTGGNPLTEGINIGSIVLLGGLIGYIYKTYNGYQNVVRSFLSEITQSLYFKDIGNNQAVLTALIDEAEEEECKEAVLGYYFLLTSDVELDITELDNRIEKWFEKTHNTKMDFDVADSVAKLKELDLMNCNERGMLTVPSLEEALRRMDNIWDNYFQYNVGTNP